MRKEPNKKLIGIFMVSGFLVLLAVFAYYVKEKVFSEDGKMIVMYFEESINGLNVGSPVVFKGVQIGKVVSIKGETFVLETTKDKTKIRFLKAAIRTVDVKAEDIAAAVIAEDTAKDAADQATEPKAEDAKSDN